MKTINFLGLQVNISLTIYRVKRMTFSIPDWADDVCVTHYDRDDNIIPLKIKYYKGSERFYIDLPKCKKAKEVSVTPHYDMKNNIYNTNRVIIVDLFK